MNQSIAWEEHPSRAVSEDAELVLAAQQDPAAFRPLYQKWLTPVYRYFFFRLGNVKDAEDLTSQVFLKAMEDLPRYRSRYRFSTWLFTIAHARIVDYFRKGGREVALENAECIFAAQDPLVQTIRDDELDRLVVLVRRLKEGEQELIRLRFFAGLNYREIGEIVHRSEEAVRKSISRLLERLHVGMEEDHE